MTDEAGREAAQWRMRPVERLRKERSGMTGTTRKSVIR